MRKGIFNTFGINKKPFSGKLLYIIGIMVLTTLTVTPKYYIAKYLMIWWAVFLGLSFAFFYKTNSRIRRIGIIGGSFVLICAFYRVIGLSSAVMGYCITNPFVYFVPIIALAIVDCNKNIDQLRFLFNYLSLIIAINVLDSIRITYQFGLDNVVYQQLAETLGEEGFVGLNLGGSLFVNMIVFYTSVMVFAFLKSRVLYEKVIFLIYFAIGSYFIVFCSLKASAVVLLFVSIILQYIADKGGKQFGRTVTVAVIIVGLFMVFRDTIINTLLSLVGSERLSVRLDSFTSTGNINENDTFVGRENLWLVSLQSWLRNPLTFVFGIGDHHWNEFSSTAASGIGNHSDLLDVLGRYGLLGGLMLYSSIKLLYDYLREKTGNIYKYEIISFFILIILMGLTKKFVAGETSIVIFILFPLALRCFAQNNKYKITYK